VSKPRRFASLLPMMIAIAGCDGSPRIDANPRIVLPGTGRTIDFPGAPTTVLLEARATEGNVSVVEHVVAPRSFGAPPHVHQDEDEYFYVLEGEIRFLNDSQTVVAPTGTFAAMTRGHLHAFWNASDAPARLLLAIAPGEFATFFDEVVRELRASGAVDLATVQETITRYAKAHNIVIYPDRVPEEARPFLPR
jgi:uncharacterized cupin superfamily protein